jgi:uncharacterized glyoxalase superfamily protein PhnB
MGLAPWLSVRDSAAAARFYTAAFGAEEVYRLPGAGIVRLRAFDAEFWIGGRRLGRLVDPFGLHWEIGRPLRES